MSRRLVAALAEFVAYPRKGAQPILDQPIHAPRSIPAIGGALTRHVPGENSDTFIGRGDRKDRELAGGTSIDYVATQHQVLDV
jgi:hypothetical protein